jgi:type VI protein secretion system component Hcp
MSNSVAEAYLLIVRESNVPIIGEAVPLPFTGQIELDSWSWNLHNEQLKSQDKADEDAKALEEKKKAKLAAEKSADDKKVKTPSIEPKELIRKVTDLQKKTLTASYDQSGRDADVLKLIKKAVLEYAEIAEQANDDDKKKDEPEKMTLTFEKGADLSTTPLLYALARGDLIPRCVLTLFHRATGAPVTLAITMSDVRITSYKVDCEAETAMSDVKETWTATYQGIEWMYQNRPAASGPNFLTQGTVRVFAKGSKLSKVSPI